IKLFTSFSQENISDTQCVIYTGAHNGVQNIEVQEALQRNIPMYSLAQFVGELTNSKKTISICGCHGKTTTTALAVLAGEALGIPMSYYVGGAGFAGHSSGKWCNGGYFALESDEYVADPVADKVAKLEYIHPYAILCTNIDFDHTDVYSSIEEVEKVYLEYFKRLPKEGKLIICGEDERLVRVAKQSGHAFTTYQLNTEKPFQTALIGRHNQLNIIGVATLFSELGYNTADLSSAFVNFTGVSRRQEKIYENNNKIVFDDYGHHPAEIAATIKAVKSAYPAHHVTVLFQPHTYSRTEALKKEFIKALSIADDSFIFPIFGSAREKASDYSISSDRLIDLSKQSGIHTIQTIHTDDELTATTEKLTSQYSKLVIMTMGAGDVYKKHDLIKKALSSVQNSNAR
ncbi:MAG: cyanophycin synthetase, partial [Patescibacteria group bacterium]